MSKDYDRLSDMEFQRQNYDWMEPFYNLLHQFEPELTTEITTNKAVPGTTNLHCQ